MRRLLAAVVAGVLATGSGAVTAATIAPATAVAATGAPAASPAPAAVAKPLTFEALRALVTVREPQIAPDGSRVAYVRATGDFKADRPSPARRRETASMPSRGSVWSTPRASASRGGAKAG